MSKVSAGLAQGAVAAVKDAGGLLIEREGVREIHAKNSTDFVTGVDYAVQEFLRARLHELAPDIQFMCEEQDNDAVDPARPFWILDPVDGTTNLIRNLKHSAISLALAVDGRVELGVVLSPWAPELYTAVRGEGAFLNGKRIHVSAVSGLSGALASVGTAPGHREWTEPTFRDMRAFFDSCLDVRRSGCASLDLCDVALGRMDVYTERYLLPWDYAAGALILEEAGGRATACDGSPLSLTAGCGLCASNGALHAAALELLK